MLRYSRTDGFQSHYGLILSNLKENGFAIVERGFQSHYGLILSI